MDRLIHLKGIRMTIRFDRAARFDWDGNDSLFVTMKGLSGKGVCCWVQTGQGGHKRLSSEQDVDSFTELLPADRFYAHSGLNAEQVAHRVAACLVCIGCGPEFYDGRDSISDSGPVKTFVRASGGAAS